jgi:hypothetical protein
MSVNIVRGFSKEFVIKLRTKSNCGQCNDPFERLEDATKIEVIFNSCSSSSFSVTNLPVPPSESSRLIKIGTKKILFKSVNTGASTNDIELVFDGIDSISTVVANWNTNNPLNTVEHDSLGSEKPGAQTFKLVGGHSGYSNIFRIMPEILGKFRVVLTALDTSKLHQGEDQEVRVVVSGSSPTSFNHVFTIQNAFSVTR